MSSSRSKKIMNMLQNFNDAIPSSSKEVSYRPKAILSTKPINNFVTKSCDERPNEQDKLSSLVAELDLPVVNSTSVDDEFLLENCTVLADYDNVNTSLLGTSDDEVLLKNNSSPNIADIFQGEKLVFNECSTQPSLELSGEIIFEETILMDSNINDDRMTHSTNFEDKGNQILGSQPEQINDIGLMLDEPETTLIQSQNTEHLQDVIPSIIVSDQPIVGEEGKRVKKVNKRHENKTKRLSGEVHENRKGVIKSAKRPRNNVCKETCYYQCQKNISQELRELICSKFWALSSYTSQNNFIINNVEAIEKKRIYTKNTASRRSRTLNYFLPINDDKIRVCKTFFLSTLDLKEKKVLVALTNKMPVVGTAKEDQRGMHEPKNKTSKEVIEYVVKYISELPAVPSHYCRASSKKKYLPTIFSNLTKLYNIYKKDCQANGKKFASTFVFNDVFRKQFNIGFHKPKKDKCIFCERYNTKLPQDRTEEDEKILSDHLQEKDFIKAIFKSDQAKSNTDGYLCTSFDLQKVLNTPHGPNNMLLYYSRKYSYLNFTIYESVTKNTYCFLWGECDGKRGANEICSLLWKYSKLVDARENVTHLSLYCDSCPGQNKNRQVIAMLYFSLQKCSNLKKIELTYLLPGHTMMPVDSVHASIEHEVKNKTVWAPSEWATIITNSRSKPKPYEVDVLQFKDFFDWKQLQKNIWPSKTQSCANSDVSFKMCRRVELNKDSTDIVFYYGLQENSPRQTLKMQRPKRAKAKEPITPISLYQSKLPLSEAKYKDLKELCTKGIVPSRYHDEFLRMPHKSTVPDVLMETDEEDE